MKKLFALMLALCLLLCSAAMADAAEEDPTDGEMVALEKIGVYMYLFNSLVEDADYQSDDGSDVLYAWKDKDPESSDYLRIEGQDMSAAGIASAEDFLNVAQANGFEDAKLLELDNGLKLVVFTNKADNEACAALVLEGGYVAGFSMGPLEGQDEGIVVALGVALGSMTPIQ